MVAIMVGGKTNHILPKNLARLFHCAQMGPPTTFGRIFTKIWANVPKWAHGPQKFFRCAAKIRNLKTKYVPKWAGGHISANFYDMGYKNFSLRGKNSKKI